jgi:DivIVA domain-containing protein
MSAAPRVPRWDHEVVDDFDPGRRLTAADVHDVAFSKPPMFKRGYHEDEVDALLERIEATLRDRTAPGGMTSAELDGVTFSKPPIGKRGYNSDEVDAFLALVGIELNRR